MDPKHVMKHCQNFAIHKSGVMVNNFLITHALLWFHLQANKVPSHHINYLLNPTDRQDVPLCFTLMKEIWSLPPPATTDKPSFVAARNALHMLGSLFQRLTLPFIQVTLSLHEQLAHLSTATHLATFLFMTNEAWSKAMQVLTFKNIIVLVKNTLFCIMKAKIRTPDGEFYIILLGTDRLKLTFGIVWSIVEKNTNADILTLMFQLSHAVKCLNIFSEHPDWDCSTWHLNPCGIEDGNSDIVSKSDHITPPSWEGDVKLSKVSPITTLKLGHQMVESEFTSAGIEEVLIKLEKKGHNMTYPFGQGTKTAILDSDDDKETKQSLSTIPEPLSVEAAVEKLAATPIGEGDGPLLNIEDHASIETSRDGHGKFNPLVDIGNGKMVSKVHVLWELERAIFLRVPGLTDRLNHCAGLTCYTTTTLPHPFLDVTSIDSASNEVLSMDDPAATIVQCEGHFFLAVVQINKICFDGSSLLEISPRFLIEPAVQFSFKSFKWSKLSAMTWTSTALTGNGTTGWKRRWWKWRVLSCKWLVLPLLSHKLMRLYISFKLTNCEP